jgi:hypothetical protein
LTATTPRTLGGRHSRGFVLRDNLADARDRR